MGVFVAFVALTAFVMTMCGLMSVVAGEKVTAIYCLVWAVATIALYVVLT